MLLVTAKATLEVHEAEVVSYEAEVLKVIRGESVLSADLLNRLHEEAKEKLADAKQRVMELNDKRKDSEEMKLSLSKQFDTMKSWADMYDECGMDTKKMILSNIMKAVHVRRDYEIEIDLTVDVEQFGLLEEEPVEESA